MSSSRRVSSIKKTKLSQENKFCKYVHRICMQNRLDGYEYCIRHILEDKSAPFKQCCFMHPQRGRRCPNAAPKTEKKDNLCPLHIKLLWSKRQLKRRECATESTASLLESLEHYCQDHHVSEKYPLNSSRQTKNKHGTHLDIQTGYSSDSNSEKDGMFVDQLWKGDNESDAESVENELEDPLKHAGVYTTEEVVQITREKLIRLQSLYIDQFKWLQHVLHEKRRDYLHSVKQEKEMMGSISSSSHSSPTEMKTYQKLKALHRYHRQYGREAILKHQARERRKEMADGNKYVAPAAPQCIHKSSDQRCTKSALPSSKFCLTHIIVDPQQVLYKPCGGEKGECKTPVVPLEEDSTCIFHARLSAKLHTENLWVKTRDKTSGDVAATTDALIQESEHFQSMDDIAALGLDVVQPGSLFGLDQFGDLGDSGDLTLTESPGDLLNQLTVDDFCDTHKSLDCIEEKLGPH